MSRLRAANKMMKNLTLLILLILCTIFVVVLNLSYLRNLVFRSKLGELQHSSLNDVPRIKRRKKVHQHSDIAGTDQRVKLGDSVENTSIRVQPKVSTADNKLPSTEVEDSESETGDDSHRVAGLNCEKYGGPSAEIATEMVYWQDIPIDAEFVSPYADYGQSPKYLTFEPDEGGWNNIRMSMETATVLAQAMGRILVLPPEQDIYLLWDDKKNKKNNQFTFKDFFHFDSIADEHAAVEVISMEEFYKREALTGNLKHKVTGEIQFPPKNESAWNGHGRKGKHHWHWLRNVTAAPIWYFDRCVVGIPETPGADGESNLRDMMVDIPKGGPHWMQKYTKNPTPVDDKPIARLLELLGSRRNVCVYDKKLQNEKVIHFMGDNASGARLLVHFYAFLFFENYHQDLWTKRFVRDHLRYIDEIQCAAARIVHAVRQKAIENGDPDGNFDSFHIRRGDFQYKETRITAEEIFNNTRDVLTEGSTLFIATDEKDTSFFDPLRQHYNCLFLKDFMHLIEGINTNYMGMLDQRIASRGRIFIGAYFSTFTGYINRMRGYHSQVDKLPGWEKGEINSYFYVPLRFKDEMRTYMSIKQPMWGREFPIGWRDIDQDLELDSIKAH